MSKTHVRVEGVIINDENHLLLALHKKHGKSYWVLPGGHLDFCEKMEDGLRRELAEEVNLGHVQVKELVFIDEYIDVEKPRHMVKVGFKVAVSQRDLAQIKVVAKREAIKDVRFYSKADLENSPDTFYPSTQFFIRLLETPNG